MAPGARTKPTGQAKEVRTCESRRPRRPHCHSHAIPKPSHLFYFPSSSWPWCPDALARNRQNEKSIELNEWKSGKCINEWMTAGTVNSRDSIHLSTSRPVTRRPFSAREWAAGLWESYVSEWSNVCAPREELYWEKRRYIWSVTRWYAFWNSFKRMRGSIIKAINSDRFGQAMLERYK